MVATKTGICLNMIVRDETPVLDRLFRSVSPFIDYYVIVDTGSTDGTEKFIHDWMGNAGIDGEIHDRQWVNFGHNRQEALELAVQSSRCNWLLFIDADEELVVENDNFRGSLLPGRNYRIEKHHGDLVYSLPNLVDITQNEWQWQYPVHEALVNHGRNPEFKTLPGVWIRYNAGEGARSRGRTAHEKFLSDARLLEDFLTDHPDSSRCQFYLAQSYRDAGEDAKAREAYLKRVGMNGWAEETFVAQLEAAKVAERLDFRDEEVIGEYLRAHEMRPFRAEALYHLSRYCRSKQRYNQGYLYAKAALDIPKPESDTLFVEAAAYRWRIADELSLHAYYTGRLEESAALCRSILKFEDLPQADRKRVQKNLAFSETKNPAASPGAYSTESSAAENTEKDAVFESRTAYVTCPICEHGEFKVEVMANCGHHNLYQPSIDPQMRWMRCLKCDHIFTDGYFSDSAQELLFGRAHANQTPGHDLYGARSMASRIVEKVIEGLGGGLALGSWLDVGFGNGALMATAQEYGFDVFGVDVRNASVEAMKSQGFSAEVADFAEFRGDQAFRVISLADVLEHMPFPLLALDRAAQIIEPDGILFLSTPNRDSYVWKRTSTLGSNPFWGEIEHYHAFGQRQIYDLLEQYGFEPIRYGISERYYMCMEVLARRVGLD